MVPDPSPSLTVGWPSCARCSPAVWLRPSSPSAAVPLMIGALSAAAAAQDTTTTPTLPVTTTTVAPTTTTTVPPTTAPTTTTTLPATTTTRERPTTTTSSSTTTTTTPTKSTSNSKTWGWVLLAVVIALAALLVGLLIARTRRQGREVDWDRSVVPAVTAAELARNSSSRRRTPMTPTIGPPLPYRSTTQSKASNVRRQRRPTSHIGPSRTRRGQSARPRLRRRGGPPDAFGRPDADR